MSLKPATNIRRIIPRVCATCTYGEMKDSGFTCKRTDAHGWACFSCDVGDMFHWMTVCDRYQQSNIYGSQVAKCLSTRLRD